MSKKKKKQGKCNKKKNQKEMDDGLLKKKKFIFQNIFWFVTLIDLLDTFHYMWKFIAAKIPNKITIKS